MDPAMYSKFETQRKDGQMSS